MDATTQNYRLNLVNDLSLTNSHLSTAKYYWREGFCLVLFQQQEFSCKVWIYHKESFDKPRIVIKD